MIYDQLTVGLYFKITIYWYSLKYTGITAYSDGLHIITFSNMNTKEKMFKII